VSYTNNDLNAKVCSLFISLWNCGDSWRRTLRWATSLGMWA